MANDAETDQATVLNLMSEENLAQRVQYEMEKRGWSQERMAREMTEAGHPLHQSAISKIVNPKDGKRRSIGVDDAIGFAKVFGLSFEEMLIPLEAALDREVRALLLDIADIGSRRKVLDAEADEKIMRFVRLTEPAVESAFDAFEATLDDAALNAALKQNLDELTAWKDRTVSRLKWIAENRPDQKEGLSPAWRVYVFGEGPMPEGDEE